MRYVSECLGTKGVLYVSKKKKKILGYALSNYGESLPQFT